MKPALTYPLAEAEAEIRRIRASIAKLENRLDIVESAVRMERAAMSACEPATGTGKWVDVTLESMPWGALVEVQLDSGNIYRASWDHEASRWRMPSGAPFPLLPIMRWRPIPS